MALVGLSGRLTRSLQQLDYRAVLDVTFLNNCVNEITGALLDAGFPILAVNEMERKIQDIIRMPFEARKRTLIYQTVFDELSSMLDPGKSALIQEKGVNKSDTCAKYARYHRKKGFRPALVCADTFRTDAFVRLNKAAKDEVPVYGSYTSNPAKLASEGIEKFIKEKRDLIIVDTSGRHQQYTSLFKEMRLLARSMKPDLVIYVMDASIGQTAFDQAQAFKQCFSVGVVILTKINDNSKAGAALSAVAAAKCPMILAETGEKSEEFEAFEVEPFVSRLLNHNEYTLRIMYEGYHSQLRWGNQGFPGLPSVSAATCEKMRRYVTIMDAMTDEELDRPNFKQMSEKRVMEIAKGSDVEVREVVELLKTYKRDANLWKSMEEKWMARKIRIDPMVRDIPCQVGSTTGATGHMPFDPLSRAVRSKRSG